MQKPIEWVIAVKLEKLYSKEEIMTMYLNQFDFLHNAVGIKSAAQVYFNTTPDQLNIEQAAMLIGMAQNPSLFNPVRREELSTRRRNVVLGQMLRSDFITTVEFDSLRALPLNLNFRRIDHNEGLAPYFREYLRRIMTVPEPRLASNPNAWQRQQYEEARREWDNNPLYGFVHKNRRADGRPYNIYTDGLRIYTTVDSRMQRYAEEAVVEHMKTLQDAFFRDKRNAPNAPFSRRVTQEEISNSLNRAKRQSDRYRGLRSDKKTDVEIDAIFSTPIEMSVFSYHGQIDTIMSPMDSIRYHKFFLRTAIMSMDSRNGHVKAYVGGPNYNQFKFDMVSQGRRQVGSTIKPFLYTLAMEELGMSPCDEVMNEPITLMDELGRPWTPRNESRARIGESVTLRWALAQSNNWISAYLMSLTTPQAFVNLLRSFGITGNIDPVYSLALGVNDVSLQEMVVAYTAFPNNGIRFDPVFVTRIDDANGNTIVTFVPQSTEVFSELTSFKMISMMQSGIDSGTGARLRGRYGLRGHIAGKTGTTQNHSDGWFMGFTPTLVSGVWTGGEDRSIHFDRITEGQGANMALPIWGRFMQKVLNDPTLEYSVNDRFDFPSWFDPNVGCR
jgi:penicillin-binding protein 1A